MNRHRCVFSIAAVALSLSFSSAQTTRISKPSALPPLKLIGDIALPGISGDFDHLALDVQRQRLIIAAEDHKSLEVIDLKAGKRMLSVPNMGTPHSLLYLATSDQLYVVNGEDGSLMILDGAQYKVLDRIQLSPGADSMGYDPDTQTIFVVSGGKDVSLPYSILTSIDLASKKKTGDLRFEADHVEAMALEHQGSNLFINVTDKNEVVVVDRKKMQRVKSWKVGVAGQNSPLAFDEANRRLFVVCREPGMLVAMNSDTGAIVARLPAPGRSDDVAFDKSTHRIYVPGGEGYISVYQQQDADHYQLVGKVASAKGGKTALLVPDLDRLFVAVSPGETKGKARLLIFRVAK